MSETFAVEMLPAREGDCLIVAYGDAAAPRRLMIDTGRAATYRAIRGRLAALPAEQRTFELLIVSHVDRDHIAGVLAMLRDAQLPLAFRDVWFNGYHHLHDGTIEAFGAVQGEALSELLRRPGVSWNERFGRASVEVARAPAPIELAGGMRLTLLAPTREDLEALIPDWDRECRKAGLIKGIDGWREPPPPGWERFGPLDVDSLADTPFEGDHSTANGASIVVLIEYRDRRVLLAADGHAERLVAALRPLAATSPGGRYPLDAIKIPHHGSRYNVSRELMELVSCPRYLVSTNGSYFNHPHDEGVARVVKYGGRPEIALN